MKKLRKTLVLTVCALLVVGMLASCTDTKEPDESQSEQTTAEQSEKQTETEAQTEPEEEDKKPDDKEPGNNDNPTAGEGIAITSLADITDKRGNYYLTADIGSASAPNVTTLEEFAGTLDGKGFTVYTNATLFDTLEDGAKISNLKLDGAVSYSEATEYGAVLALKAKGYVVFTGITNNAGITVAKTENKSYIGAILARTTADVDFKDCTNSGSITVSDTATGGNCMVGGIAGNVATAGTATFKNCVNKGAVDVKRNSDGVKAGGVAGYIENGTIEISDCKNEGTVTSYGMTGGIVGHVKTSVTVTDCQNKGAVLSAASDNSVNKVAAGIIAKLEAGTTTSKIEKCANYADIKAEQSGWNNGDGNRWNQHQAGGLIAFVGNTASFVDCVNYGNISSHEMAGGIAGRINKKDVDFKFERCLSLGSVSGSKAGALCVKSNGIITLINCYGTCDSSAVHGDDGITGYTVKDAASLKGDTAKTTLATFDFTSVWKSVSGEYPTLA